MSLFPLYFKSIKNWGNEYPFQFKIPPQKEGLDPGDTRSGLGSFSIQTCWVRTEHYSSLGGTPPFADYFKLSLDVLVREELASFSEYKLRQLLETDHFLRGRNLRILSTTVDAEGRELIEVVSQRAKASYLAGFADPEFISDLPRFSLPFLPTNKKHRVFQVDGDSMLPIPDGAWIVCEYLEDWTSLKDGDRYVIVTEQDGVTFKIGYKRHQGQQKILLCSANPIYPPFEVDFEQVREVWKYRLCIS